MEYLGLKGALRKSRGASFRFRIRDFYWQLRYAWQRAWRGYDSLDVFDIGGQFERRMPVLLRQFLQHNIGLFYDVEVEKQLTKEETDEVVKQMIYYFENCDEDVVTKRLIGEWPPKWDRETMLKVDAEVRHCRSMAMQMFSKWVDQLWY